MMSDGSATPYNVVIRLAERVQARHYPMPLPVLARSVEELAILHSQEPVHNTLELCKQADVTFVGVGQIDLGAPLVVDGFMTPVEVQALAAQNVAGEITSWVFDSDGHVIHCDFNDRVASAPLVEAHEGLVVGVANGPAKVTAIRAALRGKLINALITDEASAEAVLTNA